MCRRRSDTNVQRRHVKFVAELLFAVAAAIASPCNQLSAAEIETATMGTSAEFAETDRDRAARERIEGALASRAVFDIPGVPLSDVLDTLSVQHNIPIVLDRRALADEGLEPGVPVEIHVGGISLESGLNLILDQHDLCFTVRNEVLMVTTTSADEDLPSARVYPVGGLALPPECAAYPGYFCEPDFDAVIELIFTSVEPTSWPVGSGPGPMCELEPALALVILQTDSVHRKIDALLAALRRARDRRPVGPAALSRELSARNLDPEVAENDRQRAARVRIERALASPADFDYPQVPLAHALDQLAREHGIPIFFDHRALDDEGISNEVPVDLHAGGLSLESGLNLMLEPHDLCITVQNEVLMVTTTIADEWLLITKVYPVSDLVWPPDDGGLRMVGDQPDFDAMIEAITTTVWPPSWDEVGGPGSIKESEVTGTLVISQTRRVHRDVEALVATARRARDQLPPPGLAKSGQRDSHGFLLRLFPLVSGASFDEGVAASSDSSEPSAERGADARPTAEQLVETIVAMIAPESWEANGGPGQIRAMPGAIMVRNTDAVARTIHEMLDLLDVLKYGWY